MKHLTNFFGFRINEENEKSKLTKQQFNQILEEHCSDFKWTDRPIYRSIRSKEMYHYQDAYDFPKTYTHDGVNYRKSMQSNSKISYLHNILMNHLSSWSDYPKRQVICSTSRRTFKLAENYLYRVIPFNSSKWGVVPHFDMHNVKLDEHLSILLSGLINSKLELTKPLSIEDISYMPLIRIPDDSNLHLKYKNVSSYTDSLKGINSYNDLLEFCKKVDTSSDTWVFSSNPKKPLTIQMLNLLFSPQNMNFQKMSYSEYINSKLPDYTYRWNVTTTKYTDSDKIYNVNNPDPGHEIWTDSNLLLIRVEKLVS